MRGNTKRGVVVVALAVGCVIAEVALRWLDLPRQMPIKTAEAIQGRWLFGYSAEGDYPIHMLSPGSVYREIYASNPRGYFEAGNTVTYACNSQGYRGPEFAEGPTGGVLRIAFVGDSVTFGEGVKVADTFAVRVAEALSRETRGAGVICVGENYGVPGYNAVQDWVTFDQVVRPTRPDLVVVVSCLNDADGPQFLRDARTQALTRQDGAWKAFADQFEARASSRVVRGSRLMSVIWQWRNRVTLGAKIEAHYRGLFDPGNADWVLNRAALGRLARACADEGIPLVVAVVPLMQDLRGRYPFGDLHADLRGAVVEGLGAKGIFVDLFPVFDGRDAAALMAHATDSHPNEVAHGIIAGELVERIEGSGWFPAVVEACGAR